MKKAARDNSSKGQKLSEEAREIIAATPDNCTPNDSQKRRICI
jgi:hypothetical protein